MQTIVTRAIVVLASVAAFFVNSTSGQNPEAKSYPVLSGIGVALAVDDGQVYVNKILPGTPADEAKTIEAGMRLVGIEVDGKIVRLAGKTIGEVASLIRGPVDTTVVLSVAPKGQNSPEQKVKLKRKPLALSGIPISYESMIGKALPDVPMTSLIDSSAVKVSDYRGKVLVLDFWASWCPTCYQQVEKMQQLSKDHPEWRGDVELVSVTVDSDTAKATEVIRNKRWNRTRNLAVDNDSREAIGIHAVPVVIIIGPDGTIATMAEAHAVDVEDEVLRLLNESSQPTQSSKPED